MGIQESFEVIDTTSVRVNHTNLDVEYHIDVDSIVLDRVSLPDSCGECICSLLSDAVKREIRVQIGERVRADYRSAGRLIHCPV